MKQLQDIEDPTNVKVNMSTALMKELSAKWLTALYPNLRGCPELMLNRFKEAGIVAALEDKYAKRHSALVTLVELSWPTIKARLLSIKLYFLGKPLSENRELLLPELPKH